jgi:hypothetical protein
VFGGNWRLLAAIVINNLINLPLFFSAGSSPDPNGPNSPTNFLAVTVVALEIAVTWLLVWWFGRESQHTTTTATVPSSSVP